MLSAAGQITLVTVGWWALQRDSLSAPWSPRPDAATPGMALLALLALGVLGTGLAYALQFDVFRAVGQQVSSTVTYLIPVVAVLLGVLVLGEHLTATEVIGFVIVMLVCVLASTLAIRAALRVDPAAAIGG